MRIKAALIIVAIVIVVTATNFVSNYFFTRKSITEAVEQDLALTVDIADSLVAAKMQLIKSNGATVAEKLLNVESKEEMTEIMVNEIAGSAEFTALLVYDKEKGIVAAYGTIINTDELLAESKYVQMAMNGESVISTTLYDTETNEFIMHVFIPMAPGKILAATIPGFTFSSYIRDFRIWRNGNIAILDEEATTIAHCNEQFVLERMNSIRDGKINPTMSDKEMQSRINFQKQVLSSERGTASLLFEGTEVLGTYKRITGTTAGWYVIVMVPLNKNPGFLVMLDMLSSSLFFLALGVIAAVFLSGIVTRPFYKIQEQAAKIRESSEHTNILLNAMPLTCHLWNKDYKIFDCNDESVRLFKTKNKEDFLNNFFDFSPEYQPDGQLSTEKAVAALKKAFDEGTYTLEWMHQFLDKTPLPSEVTLVRVAYENDVVVAGYLRDLREQKQMIMNIKASTAKLEAVVKNFPGIIWSADLNHVFTLYNGRYLEKIGEDPSSVIGLTIDEYLNMKNNKGFHERLMQNIMKTYMEGPQDWISEFYSQRFHNRTMPIYDDTGSLNGVMGSFDDITELSRLQAELQAALEEARDASNAKSKFLANMSHEMRTPLNAIIGLSDLTLDSGELNKNIRSNLEKIYDAGKTLLTLVNDILDISKIEAGKLELVPNVYDIPSLINDTVMQNILRISEKPIKFVLNVNENLPSNLYGDELRLRQIISNLLSNSFKYTKEGKVELGVYCEREGESVWMTIRVRDTGIGIKPEDIGKLFRDYRQIDKGSNRKIEGTGLGLSITKKLAGMMDGSVSVESEYGKGSVFTVKVKQKYVSCPVIGKEIAENLKSLRYSDQKRKKNSQLVRIKMPNARVLIVDDMKTNLDVAKGIMSLYGMQIDCALSGQEAVDAIRNEKHRYDAVFMDHMMPEMDGMEAVRIIREEIGTEYAKTVPIIALTANAILGNEEMFLSRGFQDFISKPIDVKHLDAILHTWIASGNNPPADEVTASTDDLEFFRKFGPKGIDYARGLERFSEKEVYLDVMRSFHLHTPALLEKIRSLGSSSASGIPLSEYAVIVHGLKGSCYGISANLAGKEAEKLETAARAGDLEQVRTKNSSFIKMMESLLLDLGELLQKTAVPMEKKGTISAPDADQLSRLLDATRMFKANTMEQIISDLESWQYESGTELVGWLRNQMDNLEYANIRERLESLV